MLKITFGKTRYNADKLILNEADNILELGNGYRMKNLAPNVKLADFLDYINHQYMLGDNIINAEIWFLRNGGSETEPNYMVEKIVADDQEEKEDFRRSILVDGDGMHHYGFKIIHVHGDTILFETPRALIQVYVQGQLIPFTATALEESLTAFEKITLHTIATCVNHSTANISSETFLRS